MPSLVGQSQITETEIKVPRQFRPHHQSYVTMADHE